MQDATPLSIQFVNLYYSYVVAKENGKCNVYLHNMHFVNAIKFNSTICVAFEVVVVFGVAT